MKLLWKLEPKEDPPQKLRTIATLPSYDLVKEVLMQVMALRDEVAQLTELVKQSNSPDHR